jgi:subtilisin family serine protease
MRLFHPMGYENSLYAVQPSAKYWHIAEIHKVATGRNVMVAVVDSGVEDTHPDLTGQVAIKENFVDSNPYAPERHGTAVAGIIAAHTGTGAGIVGVAPGARVMALRACWQEPEQDSRCSSFTLGRALNFAIQHDAKVINLSLSGPPDRLLQRLLDVALERDITVVGAVDPGRSDGGFPASHPGVIAVAEQAADGNEDTGGPNWFRAPGHDIPTTSLGARWGFVSGSSYAAAHVSGMVALISELRPLLTPVQIRLEIAGIAVDKSLVRSLVKNQDTPVDNRQGVTIDACATISRVTGACTCLCATVNAPKVPNYQ